MKKLTALLAALALVASGCSLGGGDEGRVMTIQFSRAVQTFPGNSVRVLGVTVGRVIDVTNEEDSAQVTIRIDDPDIKLPDDVKATIVPVSLLGERYIQFFPAYEGGPTYTADNIPIERTSVPAEQDELLRGLQDYFGAIDPDKVNDFIQNAAVVLDGNGENINRLIDEGSDLVALLARKKDSLAGLIQELNTVTVTLSTRQDAIARLINSYNTVGHALNDNRAALEGTITGLSAAATELASLISDHRNPLDEDVRALTKTMRTLSRNAESFAETGKWARRLFGAAKRAMDYERNWLRLGNQGKPLEQLLLFRLQDRLVGVCLRLGIDECSDQRYWEGQLPSYFCTTDGSCDEKDALTPGEALDRALKDLPDGVRKGVKKEFRKKCKNAPNPKKCRERKSRRSEGEELDDILNDILDGVNSGIDGIGGTL